MSSPAERSRHHRENTSSGGKSGDGGNRTRARFPAHLQSGAAVSVDGLATKILGRTWSEVRGEWSYRIMHDRSQTRDRVYFHAFASEVSA